MKICGSFKSFGFIYIYIYIYILMIIIIILIIIIIIMPLKVVFLDENCRVISYNMHHLFSKTKIFPFLIIKLNS